MPRGPKSAIERDDKGLQVFDAWKAGSTLRELSDTFGYSMDQVHRYVRKLQKNSQSAHELAKVEASSPGVGEAARLHRELVEGELLKQYERSNHELQAALEAGDKSAAARWLSKLTPILALMARAVGMDRPLVNVAQGVAVGPAGAGLVEGGRYVVKDGKLAPARFLTAEELLRIIEGETSPDTPGPPQMSTRRT